MKMSFSKLPAWMRGYVPRFIYVTEKGWNYYPYTETGMLFSTLLVGFNSIYHYICIIWRPLSLSEITPMIFDLGLTQLQGRLMTPPKTKKKNKTSKNHMRNNHSNSFGSYITLPCRPPYKVKRWMNILFDNNENSK